MQRMKVSRPISPILPLKLDVVAASLERSKEEDRAFRLRLIAYHLMKTG